jgi:hypothetical protein
MHPELELTMDGDLKRVVKETKFLGLILDKNLSFVPHRKHLKIRSQRALDILRVLSSSEWGADRDILLLLYRTLVRSTLAYGRIVYGSATDSYIKLLDMVNHQGLLLALGAFRTSPVQSLHIEANEASIKNRRLKLALQYVIKL